MHSISRELSVKQVSKAIQKLKDLNVDKISFRVEQDAVHITWKAGSVILSYSPGKPDVVTETKIEAL